MSRWASARWGVWALAGALFLAACASDSTQSQDGDGGAAGGEPPAEAGSELPSALRIANFNARNLFNDKIDGESGVLDEASNTPSTADYRKKLSAVAGILAKLDADIIALQEVENIATLNDLAARPELTRAYPYRILVPGNDPRGIDVAMLSAYPFDNTISHKADRFSSSAGTGSQYKYARDCLEVHFTVQGRKLVLFNVHFRSKVDDLPDKRLAEAEHTRALADAQTRADSAAAVVILGDFNDYPGTAPINAIQGPDSARYASTGLVLPAASAWTVTGADTPSGNALHDDQRSNSVMTGFLQPQSVTILHDSDLGGDSALINTSDHAPVVAEYVFSN